jgi:hypothetical protein
MKNSLENSAKFYQYTHFEGIKIPTLSSCHAKGAA